MLTTIKDVTGLYEPPVPLENSNYRLVENRITINATHTTVFDFVTNWSNLSKWLPMAANTTVLEGESHVPAKLGDVLLEEVKDEELNGQTISIVPKIYTVVVRIPGTLWVVTGTDKGDSWTRWVAYFATVPLAADKTLFSRVFAHVVKDPNEPVRSVIDPKANQSGLECLKMAIESGF